MNIGHHVAWFFAGFFLLNAIPHTVAGVMGESFQTPFAKPRGHGRSSSTANVLWGFLNLLVGWLLLRTGDFNLRAPDCFLTTGLASLLFALFLARRFGRFNGGNLD